MRLRDDRRGQAIQIGAVLLFGILIISFSTYQAFIIPNQNKQVEFDHFETVRDDMTDVRSAIYRAKTSGNPQSATVKLGTDYPSRLVSLNPSPATGRLSTGEKRDITIVDSEGNEINLADRYSGIDNEGQVYTRLLTYEPSYNVFQGGGPIRHEHSVLYLDYRETPQRGGVPIQNENQKLVSDNKLTLLPIQGEYQESGVSKVSIEPEPGILQTRQFEDVTVTVPTKLDEDTWEELLSDELPANKISVDEENEQLTLELDGTWDIEYAPVGLDGTPEGGERGSAGSDINPASPGDIALVGSTRNQNDNNWELKFKNSGETTSFSEGRVNFYPGTASALEYIKDSEQNRSVSWNVGDDFKTIDPAVELAGDDQTTTVTLGFDQVNGNDEWFVVTFTLESGEQATYFVAEGGSGVGTQTLQAVEANGVDTSSDSLQFTVENTGSQRMTVDSFSVGATDIDEFAEIDDGNNAEFQTNGATPDGEANKQTNDCSNSNGDNSNRCVFYADGTSYGLDKNLDLKSGDSASVEFRAFEATSDGKTWPSDFTFADSEADADLVVTLGLSDGSEEIFYFKQV